MNKGKTESGCGYVARRMLTAAMLLLVAACVQIPDLAQRRSTADTLAAEHGWQATSLPSDSFRLRAYLPPAPVAANMLTVYLEGDGLAWLSPDTPSADPTPTNPLALQLALRDRQPAAYLARPCQYGSAEESPCRQVFWTRLRFAPEVVQASNQALDQLKQRFRAQRLLLVGYSGGGTLAALLAARRQDVAGLITIASSLDHLVWAQDKRLSPLTGSLNPADDWRRLQWVPQRHYVGTLDKQVGRMPVAAYVARFPVERRPELVEMPDFDHHCCWLQHWPALKLDALARWHLSVD
ncbi:alpha/beta hydrolase [Vogesella oryzae]|uniref:alpha/beta hydrolase n=1 Tax=Vogesella oryzae TaxID=1735285 RepID=UPI001C2EE3D1|nr:alpha/beta hydrolase [Vogesella oryzae]